jgi:putative hydrolase of HD superfamily
MDLDRLDKQMDFITRIDALKSVVRQTALVDRSRQENSAEHSWHIAVMALLLSEYSNAENLDLLRVVKMLLVHDLVEIYAGDTFLYDDEKRQAKEEEERRASEKLFGLLPQDQAIELHTLWQEFEEERTPESRFAKALDALQPVLLGYANKGWSWERHSISKDQVLSHKKPVRIGSEQLWEYLQKLLEKAVKEGFLQD